MLKLISQGENDTFNIGVKVGNNLKSGDVVAFFGDLGAGKTALTRGIASSFGIDNIHSPTFTLVNEYYGESINIYHFDAYRIDSDGWIDSGFDEYLYAGGICIIEWAENLTDILPPEAIKITISTDLQKGECYRDIKIEGENY